MEQRLFEIMKRASLFVILAQTLLHFCPKESYEKYLHLLVSLMTVTVLVFPVLELGKSGLYDQFERELNEYETQIKQLVMEAQSSHITDEMAYLSTISDEIKDKLNKTGAKEGYVVETVEIQGISEDGTEMENQEKSLKIQVKREKTGISTIAVDKIKCSGNSENFREESTGNSGDQEIASKLRKLYAEELGMREADLEVSVE